MPHVHGKNVDVKILDVDAVEQNITSDGNSVTLTWTNDIAELRAFGAAALEKLEGVPDWGWEFTGYYHTTASQIDEILGNIATCVSSSTAACIAFGGAGATEVGCPVWYGNCILAEYAVEAPSDGPVTVTATFAGSGALSRSVIAAGGSWTP